jgi:hypothetical protein
MNELHPDLMRLRRGSNNLRMITAPYVYTAHRVHNRVEKCTGFNGECKFCAAEYPTKSGYDYQGEAVKSNQQIQRWMVGVIDRANKQVKILDFPSNIYQSIQKLSRNEKWGDPKEYDMNIHVDPDAGECGLYTVMPNPKHPLSETDVALVSCSDDLVARMAARCNPSKTTDYGFDWHMIDPSSLYTQKYIDGRTKLSCSNCDKLKDESVKLKMQIVGHEAELKYLREKVSDYEKDENARATACAKSCAEYGEWRDSVTIMSPDAVDCCRRIGRDEQNRCTTIGLAEIDALCASHEALRKVSVESFKPSITTTINHFAGATTPKYKRKRFEKEDVKKAFNDGFYRNFEFPKAVIERLKHDSDNAKAKAAFISPEEMKTMKDFVELHERVHINAQQKDRIRGRTKDFIFFDDAQVIDVSLVSESVTPVAEIQYNVKPADDAVCSSCKETYPYAKASKDFKCWSCKNNA